MKVLPSDKIKEALNILSGEALVYAPWYVEMSADILSGR